MERKDHDFIDSELKKISIKDFKYEGNGSGDECIFLYKKVVDDDDSCCIVLNGKAEGKVEIEAETDYDSGADEYIDQVASLGSWNEAIEYLKRNVQKIVKKVEERYEYHRKVKAKTAKIASRVLANF